MRPRRARRIARLYGGAELCGFFSPVNSKKMTAQDAINHIQALYPPDSQYDDTRAIGRELMDSAVGNKVGYINWRDLPYADLIALAKENLIAAGECVSDYA